MERKDDVRDGIGGRATLGRDAEALLKNSDLMPEQEEAKERF